MVVPVVVMGLEADAETAASRRVAPTERSYKLLRTK